MRGMGDFRKEYVQCFRLISREKNSCEEILGEKKSRTEKKKAFKAYNPGKMRRASGKKILSPEIYQKNYFSNQITRTPRPLLNLIKWLAVIVDTSCRSVSVVGQHKQRQNRGFPCKGKQFSPNDQIHG